MVVVLREDYRAMLGLNHECKHLTELPEVN
jgi:hypothetical protein